VPDAVTPIRIMVVDDHPVVRHGLVSFVQGKPGLAVVAEADTGEEAVRAFREHRPDITLMDLRLPGLSGVGAIGQIRKEFPDARFIVLTTYDGDEAIYAALEAGAFGYLLKSVVADELVSTIREVHAGKKCIPPDVAQKLVERMFHPVLTPRELDVLRLVARGLSNKEVGAELGMSPGTA